MDDGHDRSLTRQLCLAHARDTSVNAQQHLHGHRTCTCLEMGGSDHKCKFESCPTGQTNRSNEHCLTQRKETCRRFGEFVASYQNCCTHLSSVRALFSQLFFDPYTRSNCRGWIKCLVLSLLFRFFLNWIYQSLWPRRPNKVQLIRLADKFAKLAGKYLSPSPTMWPVASWWSLRWNT